EIRLESAPGEGSTFTLYLPLAYITAEPPGPSPEARGGEEGDGGSGDGRKGTGEAALEAAGAPARAGARGERLATAAAPAPQSPRTVISVPAIEDDRHSIQPDDRALLIVEDDLA